MKARLPKMLLAALLAAVSTAYALPDYVVAEGSNHYYYGGSAIDPIDIADATYFGSGVSADPNCTVNIGYSEAGGATHDGMFTLKGDYFSTPNALFIGGPGWPHKLSDPEGYGAAEGSLTLDGAILTVGTNILMGTCAGADSGLHIVNDSAVFAGNLQVSNGGGLAIVKVGSELGGETSGALYLDGDLAIGVNDVTKGASGQMLVNKDSLVDVKGSTSIGYATDEGIGGWGFLYVNSGATMTTSSLEAGIGMIDYASETASRGAVTVSGTLNVTGSEHDTIIGLNGGQGYLAVFGTANLGTSAVYVGSTSVNNDTTKGGIEVNPGGTLNHKGSMYVGDKGIEGRYGVGELKICKDGFAKLNTVEVSEDSMIVVNGTLQVNETPDSYGIQGVRLYHGAILAGSPDNQGGQLTFSVVPEHRDFTNTVISDFTLTKGTTLKACCNNHLLVGGDSTLTFGQGTLWLTDGIGYIDRGTDGLGGTITANGGTGHISVADNQSLNEYLNNMGSEKSGSQDKVGLILTSDFIDASGSYDDFTSGTGTLQLNRSGFEVRFTESGVDTLNAGEGFRGFYVVKTEYPAEPAYPSFDRNQREVYDLIKQMEESGMPIPPELEQVINEVLNMDGKEEVGKIQDALDFLGAVNYSVMMHNQIEANLSHQHMLRNRSMVGRNLRHGKGCTDLYAAGFYNNQRLKGDREKGTGYRRNEWGGMIGGDTCINENLRLGADVALGWSNITPTRNMKLKQRSVYWDVYAQLRKGNWRSLTALGMGIHNFKVERGLNGVTAKKNNVRGLSLNISEEVTYDWKVNEKTTIQPFAAVDLSWNRINSFTDGELGALNMHVAKQDAFIAEFTVGGRYIRDFACVTDAPDATWYFQLGVAVDAGDLDSDMECNFAGTHDSHFTIKGNKRDRVGLDLGTGITIPVTQHWAIYGNAEVIFRGDSHNLNAQVGAQYAF